MRLADSCLEHAASLAGRDRQLLDEAFEKLDFSRRVELAHSSAAYCVDADSIKRFQKLCRGVVQVVHVLCQPVGKELIKLQDGLEVELQSIAELGGHL